MSAVEQRMADLDRGFDALERVDLDGFMEIVEASAHPDCEFTSAIGTALGGGTYRGYDGIRSWFADLLETIDKPKWRERRYEAVGDDAFLFFATYDMRGPASGINMTMEIGQVYELDESGLLKRGVSFTSHAEARDAAEALHA